MKYFMQSFKKVLCLVQKSCIMFYPLKFVHKYKCVTMMLLSSSIVTHAIVSDNIPISVYTSIGHYRHMRRFSWSQARTRPKRWKSSMVEGSSALSSLTSSALSSSGECSEYMRIFRSSGSNFSSLQ